MKRSFLLSIFTLAFGSTFAQQRPADPLTTARAELTKLGITGEDVSQMRVADGYTDAHNGVTHTWLRQQWNGVDVFNSEVALHTRADGSVLSFHHKLARGLGKLTTGQAPRITAEQALRTALSRDGERGDGLVVVRTDASKHTTWFSPQVEGAPEPHVQLVWVMKDEEVRLAWNVNFSTTKSDHWWNVRLDALTGEELERNDWVAQCAFDLGDHTGCSAHAEPGAPPMPASPNDYNAYPAPVESPSHGGRVLHNAPWTLAPNASPFGWHDVDGIAGADSLTTYGNNVVAQEDANGNNGNGRRANGGPTLDFDFPVDLSQAPLAYQDAAITNLFYWNNIIHDVWYQYGFDEVSGNFQRNNYGNGGAGNDLVQADAQDGSGTDNANFGTPADGSAPRMQMFLWTAPNPDRDGDFDNGIITHEYGHGISNRLVGGPSNVNCLGNAEQMGEGWSDWFGLMMTIEPGDTRTDARGIGTYALNEPVSGPGIRPAPYSTNFAVNNYTYANTNSGVSQPHGIGFVWCTMLWEMTWDLIDLYGFDPDLYNGTGGNNIAMRLVTDGLKLTACNPGFVDGRNAILQADIATYGGAHQDLIWAAFARRGLGFSANQGLSTSRSDQVEAFNLPVNNSVGIDAALNPTGGGTNECSALYPVVRIRNTGILGQSGFNVSYQLDGGTVVTEPFVGVLASQATSTHTFATPLPALSVGVHSILFSADLVGDQFMADNSVTINFNNADAASVPYIENLESGSVSPTGWRLENPDNGATWTNVNVASGPLCAATQAWRINYYSYNAPSQKDILTSPVVNLAGSADLSLRFHQSYAQYSSAYIDSLRVQVSADCGSNWTTIWQAWAGTLATATTTTSSYTPTACAQWQLRTIDLSAFEGQRVQFRFVGVCGFGNNLYLDNAEIVQNGVRLSLALFLEGPYDTNTGLMRDDLRTSSYLPALEPYTAAGFTQAAGGGGESVQTGVLARTGNNAIVDWVQVELRSASTPSTIVATRPALLQRDGDVVAEDGVQPIALLAPNGDYHVVVRHRNHFGCMTASPIALTGTTTALDFRTSATLTYGTNARKVVGGVETLVAGNVQVSGLPAAQQLLYTGAGNDRDPILVAIGSATPNNIISGYLVTDVNMDGTTQYTGAGNDRDPILINVGSNTPNNVRQEQVP